MPFLRENTGQWSPIKIAAFAGAIAPALWMLGRIAFGDLGARPVTVVLHFCGDWAVRFVFLSLAITPARRLFAAPRLIQARRTLGVAAFGYALCHFSLYVTDQMFDVQKVASEIALRLYLTIGFTTLTGLIALGLTSTDAAVRRLKQRWGTLHRVVYVISVLAVVHFMMQKKLDIYEPTWMAGLLFWLLSYRVVHKFRREVTETTLLALALSATLFTMLAEAAWYGALTGVDSLRILAANFDPAMDIRPAWWVLAATIGIILVHLAAKWLWPLPARTPRPAPQAELKPAE
jgi:sulfoxide reductase heme-binding subunit YedZ